MRVRAGRVDSRSTPRSTHRRPPCSTLRGHAACGIPLRVAAWCGALRRQSRPCAWQGTLRWRPRRLERSARPTGTPCRLFHSGTRWSPPCTARCSLPRMIVNPMSKGQGLDAIGMQGEEASGRREIDACQLTVEGSAASLLVRYVAAALGEVHTTLKAAMDLPVGLVESVRARRLVSVKPRTDRALAILGKPPVCVGSWVGASEAQPVAAASHHLHGAGDGSAVAKSGVGGGPSTAALNGAALESVEAELLPAPPYVCGRAWRLVLDIERAINRACARHALPCAARIVRAARARHTVDACEGAASVVVVADLVAPIVGGNA